MASAHKKQKFQDWFTQQWAIFWGKRISVARDNWLAGPFGEVGTIGDGFVYKIANEEGLEVARNCKSAGLIRSLSDLKLAPEDAGKLSPAIADFYENTGSYKLKFSVHWNPFFKFFGTLVNSLFSSRINQLNVPTKNMDVAEGVNSEIIQLVNPLDGAVKYTVWYRTFKSTGLVLYSGVYTTCILPGGTTCVKAIFPLPHGNATVIMRPSVTANIALMLDSSGQQFGDAGFYFTLRDDKGRTWAQYLSSFRDRLVVSEVDRKLEAVQTLTLWKLPVARFIYSIEH